MTSCATPAASQAIPSPIVFLDVDGVLNDLERERGQLRPRRFVDFKPDCVRAFNTIIDATAAKIVLSSNWRGYIINGHMDLRGFNVLLRSHGIVGELVGHTREDFNSAEWADGALEERWMQILDWLANNPHDKWCIIDDRRDAFPTGRQPHEFGVQTDPSKGLTISDAMRAIKVLNDS